MRFTTRRQSLSEILFPRTCAICKRTGSALCPTCKSKLKPYPEVCSLCNRYAPNYTICFPCKQNQHCALEQIIIGFYYDSYIKKLLLDLKYRHRYDTANFLADRLQHLIAIYLPHNSDPHTTAIIGIPSHWRRKYIIKGYNQSEVLAQQTAKKIGLPYLSPVKKIKNTSSQVHLNKAQRLNNLKNSFRFKKEGENQLKKIKNLIIIDDITTTGASLNTLATYIKTSYPKMRIF